MIGFSFKWPSDTKTPKLVALTVNGIPYTCIEGGMYYYFSICIQNHKYSQSSEISNRFCDFCFEMGDMRLTLYKFVPKL